MGRKRPHKGSRRRRGRSGVRRSPEVVQGIIRVIRPGVAELRCAEGTYPVARGGIREAMDGDEVQAALSVRRGQDKLAWVRAVINRKTLSFAGIYQVAGPLGAVEPLDGRIKRDFFVLPEDESPRRLKVAEGDLVDVRILEYPTRHSAGVVTIERRMGSPEGLDIVMEEIIASHGLSTEFSQDALAQARAVTVDVERELADDPSRRDLRDELCVTVDPPDARDFDDAVGARRLEDGYEIAVHIADVSSYVAWDTPLDLEARRRTCSVYLADRVIPMLPEELSNDACSLVPHEGRLAMTVRIRLDANGVVRHAQAFRSAICSRARLDYPTVDQLLTGEIDAQALPCEDADASAIAEMLQALDEVRGLREKIRHERGAIDFKTREAKVRLDEQGKPLGVDVRQRTRATGLIEEAMLLANESVATMLSDADLPAAYRVHERPAPDDLKRALPIARELGLADSALAERLVAGEPAAVQKVLERSEDTSTEVPVTALLLRAQKRAIYLPHNEGHYALGAPAYCHFTSPIRRYPDVMVHRALKDLLDHKQESKEAHQRTRLLPQICRSCSEGERVADAAARDSQKAKMAELYLQHKGESFSGVVVGCERYGLFVELDESCAEGLLPVRALGDEWFSYDEARLSLTGEESGTTWRLGQRVAVTVAGADPRRGQIDFVLAHGKAPNDGASGRVA